MGRVGTRSGGHRVDTGWTQDQAAIDIMMKDGDDDDLLVRMW